MQFLITQHNTGHNLAALTNITDGDSQMGCGWGKIVSVRFSPRMKCDTPRVCGRQGSTVSTCLHASEGLPDTVCNTV